MIHFDLPKEKSSIIKVIGVGGGGSNAVNYMFSQKIDGVNFIICNTDAQAIALSLVPNKVQLGPHLTQGLGAGANPEIGRQATEESLEEIKRILEVNTKMAFITAGMGGGTGTGGAPIISQICKDLGILTVGIVTTPFAYEGRKRQQQAEEGIKILKQYVDTLLVISNDKLRHQFGNLKMREAFAKADNVLATAAKCITDVINSTGQINVDFADVCTVMKNGGVAILGSAAVEGEDRARRAIEEALNSPLLNDNDISGAKWILININSAEGEHEFTMDEVEIIQNHLLTQAGEGTDVILGLGYDNSLEDKIGITLIATGFQHKDPFTLPVVKKPEPKEEKIIMVLGQSEEELKQEPRKLEKEVTEEKTVVASSTDQSLRDELAPRLVETIPSLEESFSAFMMFEEEDLLREADTEILQDESVVIHWELDMKNSGNSGNTAKMDEKNTVENDKITVEKNSMTEKKEIIISESRSTTRTNNSESLTNNSEPNSKISTPPVSAASGGYLARPSNIYAESQAEVFTSMPSAEEPVSQKEQMHSGEESLCDMQMVLRDDIPAADEPLAHQAQTPLTTTAEDPAMRDEAEEQKRRAAERLHKLRNLSFNVHSVDPNSEFENVPAYIRRNMELYGNSISAVENFYSNYTVKKDENNNTQISTLNTFLDGKKPD
ncbi:MAG: cell division protein FtsZ [Bacteroidetes bacterium]|nr:MAG: cell division protein FtsZ [Bacteroidota bacterium]